MKGSLDVSPNFEARGRRHSTKSSNFSGQLLLVALAFLFILLWISFLTVWFAQSEKTMLIVFNHSMKFDAAFHDTKGQPSSPHCPAVECPAPRGPDCPVVTQACTSQPNTPTPEVPTPPTQPNEPPKPEKTGQSFKIYYYPNTGPVRDSPSAN